MEMRENVQKELLDIQKRVLTAGLLVVASLLFACGQAMAVPTPHIQANGGDMSFSVALDCGSMSGMEADWWLAAQTPSGWYYFDVAQGTWMPGTSFLIWQGPLFSFPNVELPGLASLPVGSSTFYFGIDTNMNSLLDADLYYDSVVVQMMQESLPSHDVETIFNWAEDNFPRFFPPPGALTQSFEPWLYRYYPSTDIYVGVNISCEVWVLGDVFGGLVYISTVQELLDTITPPPAPIPDILGTYSGSLAATTTECSEGGDGAFTLTGGITITSHQVGEAFKASGELMVERFGVLFRLNIDFSGSATSAGILNGRYTYAFSGENGFYSNGSGTFTGSVSGNTLTIQLSGLDTDIFGETCVVNGTFTGMLY
jgi:hypothetical protein